MFFHILLNGKLSNVGYPTMSQAAADWMESGRHGQVVQISADNRVFRAHSGREAEESAADFVVRLTLSLTNWPAEIAISVSLSI